MAAGGERGRGERLSIGELSRRTGVPVKTLRFYSDEGLLPPSGRSRSNYRLYAEEHVVRIELIRTLREAGISLEEIGKVLRRDMTLEEALRLRLRAVEAHVASLQRVAAALRAALRAKPNEHDLRRISMVTRLSNDERKKAIESFYAKVYEGLPIDRTWIKGMIEASAPTLPDDATAEQLDAWIELAGILEDPSFVESMRANAADFWTKDVDMAAFNKARSDAATAAREARAHGIPPTSEEGRGIAERFFQAMASASGEKDSEALRAKARLQADPRAERYWELVEIMKGQAVPSGTFDDMKWLSAAIRHHIVAAGTTSRA